MPTKVVINKSELAEKYGLDRGTIIRYTKKYVKNDKNPTEKELATLNKELKKLSDQKEKQKIVDNALKDIKVDKKVEFKENSSSTSERLAVMREQYNYCLALYEKNKMKVNATIDDDTIDDNLKAMYQKNYRETAKTMMAYDTKVKELEKDLSLMNIEEDNPLAF